MSDTQSNPVSAQTSLTLTPIGQCDVGDGRFAIHLTSEHRSGLKGLADFSHAVALWWAHEVDSVQARTCHTFPSPYTATSDEMGVFSTRSEARPNPIGLTVFPIASVDLEEGVILSHYFDMLPGTPILDIKPYFPASDRVEEARVPDHFSHWPTSYEASADFDWDKEFRFQAG